MPAFPKDITGQRYGRLLVRSYAGKSKWNCLCDCGGISVVSTDKIKSGHTTSCGCRQRETAPERCRTHGLSKTPTYRIWAAIKRRCTNPNCPEYKDYGGRGIKICEKWMSFEGFLSDMGEAPEGLEIDRRDNDGDYRLSNCFWVTRQTNCNNRRSNRWLTWNGRTLTIAQWSRELGINQTTIKQRLVLNWPIDQALGEPVRKKSQ